VRRHTNPVQPSWTISVAILVVCLLASIVIAITKLT
jgi:hypothetical protein